MSISFRIDISGFPVEINRNIAMTVRSKRANISYRQKVSEDEVQLAYLESEEMYSHKAINVTNYLPKSLELEDEGIYISNSNVIESEKENLIFTIFTSRRDNGISPVFYGHKFPDKLNNYSIQKDLSEVSFAPWNKSIDPNLYTYNKEYNVLLCDLENELDVSKGIYRPSFVLPNIKYVSLDGNTEYMKKPEVFRREPVFTEESIYDYPISAGQHKLLYIKEKTNSGWRYSFPYLQGENIYYKENSKLKPAISISENLKGDESWPLEITGNGIAIKTAEPGNPPLKYTYTWTRSNDIFYFPYYPFLTYKKKAQYVNEKTFLVPNRNIILGPDKNIHFTFKVIRNDVIIIAQSTKENLIGKRVSGSFKEKNLVYYERFTGSLDYTHGIVSLNNSLPLRKSDVIIAEYCVKQDQNEKEILNVNPCNFPELENGPILLFAIKDIPNQKEYGIKYVHLKRIRLHNEDGQIRYSYTILKSSYALLNDYRGKDLNILINEQFLIDLNGNYVGAGEKLLPMAMVNFNKEHYTKHTSLMDLRVFGGIKDDMLLLNRGKDFAFSNLLHTSDYCAADLNGQYIAFVDRKGIPNYSTGETENQNNLNIKNVIASTIGVNYVSHIKYKDYPIVRYLYGKKIDQETASLKIKIKKPSEIFTKLQVLLSEDRIMYPDTPVLLAEAINIDSYTPDVNNEIEVSVNISWPSARELKINQYIYFKVINEIEEIESSNSPIASVLFV